MKKPIIVAISILLIFLSIIVYNQNNPKDTKSNFLRTSLASDLASTDNFTIIVLPDAQGYSENYPWIFENQTRWIADNVDSLNIAFVTQLGDLVDIPYNSTQWDVANQSMSKLDGMVPWAVLLGNHDVYNNNLTDYNTYFGPDRFGNETWYGGVYMEGDNSNSYQIFSAGKADYLIFHIQYNPGDDVLFWADSIIDRYPDRRVIVSTHDYMMGIFGEGQRSEIGERIWHGLIRPNAERIFLVLCGHSGTEDRIADSVDGDIVFQVLADFQSSQIENGWLRILEFFPNREKIFVKTYSPVLDEYKCDPQSEFVLNYQSVIATSNTSVTEALDNQIVIRSDGSIEPSNASISRNGNIYTFNEDIFGSLVIEKENVVVDGAGFTLRGIGVEYQPIGYTQIGNYTLPIVIPADSNMSYTGIYSRAQKLTVSNLRLSDFWCAIKLEYASDNCIVNNEFSNNTLGLRITYSSNNTIANNTFTNNTYGMALKSSYDSIQNNTISNNTKYGIKLSWSFNNITSNLFSNNNQGVCLTVSSHNLFTANIFQNNSQQVNLDRIADDNLNDGISLFDDQQPLINAWDDVGKGNFWSDYCGTDNDNDGSGDSSYIINKNNIDRYPLVPKTTQESPSPSIPEFPMTDVVTVVFVAVFILNFALRKRRQ